MFVSVVVNFVRFSCVLCFRFFVVFLLGLEVPIRGVGFFSFTSSSVLLRSVCSLRAFIVAFLLGDSAFYVCFFVVL